MLISSSDPLLPTSRAGALLWTVAGLASLAAVATAPVLTFLILIVGFGLMHVLTELRYVDARFSGRVQRRWILLALALVGAIALTRVFLIAQWIPYRVGIGLEVALGIALAILGTWAAPRYRLAVGIGVLIFTAIAIASPLHALLTVAVLHNLTPLGFLAERLRAPERGPVLMILSIPFIAIPLLFASGLPLSVAHSLFGSDPGWAPFAAGPAEKHMGAFLPPEVIAGPYAMQAFAGAVFAQIMHYVAVIIVLPRLMDEKAATLMPWPKGQRYWIAASGACAALAAYYLTDYDHARSLYGLFAAIHSWLEVPLLIAALALSQQVQPHDEGHAIAQQGTG